MTSEKISGALSPKSLLMKLEKCANFTAEDSEKISFLYNIDSENDIYVNKDGIVYDAVRFPDNWSNDRMWDYYWSFCREEHKEHPNYEFQMIKKEFPIIRKGNNDDEKKFLWGSHVFVITNPEELFQIEKRPSLDDLYQAEKYRLEEIEKEHQIQEQRIKEACYGYTGVGFNRSLLPGAIGVDDSFSLIYQGYDNDTVCDYQELKYLVDSKQFQRDLDNNIFVNENGAVLNAYDFDKLNAEDKEKAINTVIEKYQEQYPNYRLTVKEGNFPISFDRDWISAGTEKLSTHVLYVQNYMQCLMPKEEKQIPRK